LITKEEFIELNRQVMIANNEYGGSEQTINAVDVEMNTENK